MKTLNKKKGMKKIAAPIKIPAMMGFKIRLDILEFLVNKKVYIQEDG